MTSALDAGPSVWLRRGSPDIVIFISGSSARLPDDMEVARMRWVRKPFEVREIVAALTETRAAAESTKRAPHAAPSQNRDPV